jgi:hypothetical protein
MCEICELEEMWHDKDTTIVQVWQKMLEIGERHNEIWAYVDICDKISPHQNGYWQGVYHALKWSIRYPEDLEVMKTPQKIEA